MSQGWEGHAWTPPEASVSSSTLTDALRVPAQSEAELPAVAPSEDDIPLTCLIPLEDAVLCYDDYVDKYIRSVETAVSHDEPAAASSSPHGDLFAPLTPTDNGDLFAPLTPTDMDGGPHLRQS